MDLQMLMPWMVFANTIVALGTAIYAGVTRGSKDNASAIVAVSGRIAEAERHILAIEGELRHLPDRDSAHRLELAVEKLNGRIETLDERMKPVAAISERMQELLLEQAKR